MLGKRVRPCVTPRFQPPAPLSINYFMDDKSLSSKAVDIKGKQYVLVSDRVLYFNEKYPNGSIETELLSEPHDDRVVVKASVYPNKFELPTGTPFRCFVGHSQAVIGEGMVNKTAALENAETSAVGRALAFMGIGVIESVASADEIHKATAPVTRQEAPRATKTQERHPNPPVYKSPAARELDAKTRIVELVDKLNGGIVPTFADKSDKAKFYGDEVFRLTGSSLSLSTPEELETIGDELGKLFDAKN
jgi:hypothetical protein